MRARTPTPPTAPPTIGPNLDELFDGELDVVGAGPKETVDGKVFVVLPIWVDVGEGEAEDSRPAIIRSEPKQDE